MAGEGGQGDGDEVIQLYISNLNSSFRVPIRELKGFQKINIKKGEKKFISLTLDSHDLSSVDDIGDRKVFPGEYKISIGGCQPGFEINEVQVISAKFNITGEPLELD